MAKKTPKKKSQIPIIDRRYKQIILEYAGIGVRLPSYGKSEIFLRIFFPPVIPSDDHMADSNFRDLPTFLSKFGRFHRIFQNVIYPLHAEGIDLHEAKAKRPTWRQIILQNPDNWLTVLEETLRERRNKLDKTTKK